MSKNCVKYFEHFLFYTFFCKVKNNRDIKGVQIYGTNLKLKTGLMDFNKIWRQQYIYIGVNYALHII